MSSAMNFGIRYTNKEIRKAKWSFQAHYQVNGNWCAKTFKTNTKFVVDITNADYVLFRELSGITTFRTKTTTFTTCCPEDYEPETISAVDFMEENSPIIEDLFDPSEENMGDENMEQECEDQQTYSKTVTLERKKRRCRRDMPYRPDSEEEEDSDEYVIEQEENDEEDSSIVMEEVKDLQKTDKSLAPTTFTKVSKDDRDGNANSLEKLFDLLNRQKSINGKQKKINADTLSILASHEESNQCFKESNECFNEGLRTLGEEVRNNKQQIVILKSEHKNLKERVQHLEKQDSRRKRAGVTVEEFLNQTAFPREVRKKIQKKSRNKMESLKKLVQKLKLGKVKIPQVAKGRIQVMHNLIQYY